MTRGTSMGVPREATVIAAAVITVLLALGWIWTIGSALAAGTLAETRTPLTATVASALPSSDAPRAAYLTDAALGALADRALGNLRGASGRLTAKIQPAPAPIAPESLPPGTSIKYSSGGEVVSAPKHPGIWNVLLAIGNAVRPVSNFNVITMLPFSAKQNG